MIEGATVIEIKRTKHSTIVHKLSDGTTKEWRSILAGLSLPTEEANGYFIILGEEWTGGGTVFEGQKPRRGKILPLVEREIQSSFLNDTLRPFGDECSLFGCRDAYAGFDEGDEDIDQIKLAREYFYDEHLDINLQPAPYFKKFKTGMDIIRTFLDKALLVLPEDSLVCQQLDSFSQYDLLEKPESKFVGLNGLRFAIAAFYKNAPSELSNWTPPRAKLTALGIKKPR
jgi:hypothetical protein